MKVRLSPRSVRWLVVAICGAVAVGSWVWTRSTVRYPDLAGRVLSAESTEEDANTNRPSPTDPSKVERLGAMTLVLDTGDIVSVPRGTPWRGVWCVPVGEPAPGFAQRPCFVQIGLDDSGAADWITGVAVHGRLLGDGESDPITAADLRQSVPFREFEPGFVISDDGDAYRLADRHSFECRFDLSPGEWVELGFDETFHVSSIRCIERE